MDQDADGYYFFKRMGEVQDIAHSTVFLFSEAATYISGIVLVVDGKDVIWLLVVTQMH